MNFLNQYHFAILLFIVTIPHRVDSVSGSCELRFKNRNKLYHYNLATPIRNYPHGILSEDGFYKVVANETELWFQLCSQMIFNHHHPSCVDYKDCGGGASRCGIGSSALVARNIGGYPICTTIGVPSSTVTELIDPKNPKIGIIVIMSTSPPAQNCSLQVSVICDSKWFHGPETIQKTGDCDYLNIRYMMIHSLYILIPPVLLLVALMVTEMKHPSGCANIRSYDGNGWGWFGTLMMIIILIFGAYVLSGAIYRHYHLGIRGIDVIPNLELWAGLPHRIQSFVMSIVRRFRGPSENVRTSYSPVNF